MVAGAASSGLRGGLAAHLGGLELQMACNRQVVLWNKGKLNWNKAKLLVLHSPLVKKFVQVLKPLLYLPQRILIIIHFQICTFQIMGKNS